MMGVCLVNSYYDIKHQSGSRHALTEDSHLYQNCLSAMRERERERVLTKLCHNLSAYLGNSKSRGVVHGVEPPPSFHQ